MPQIDKIITKVKDIQEDDLDVVLKRYPLKNPTHPTTFKGLVEDAAAAAMLKAKQADQIQKQKDKHEKEAEALKDRHDRENDRQKGLDAKETEDDAIRKQREAERKTAEKERKNTSEGVKERVQPKTSDWEGRATISRNARKNFWKSLKKQKKEEFQKTLKTWEVEEDRNYKKEYENYHSDPKQIARRSKRNEARRSLKNRKDIEGKDVHHKDNNPMNNDKSNLSIVSQNFNRREPRLREGVDADAMIDLMQKYLNTKNKNEKKTLLKQINRYQKKLGLKVTEELGKNATQDDYIKDFLNSDSPQFVGKSKDKIIKMAVAAFKSDK